MPKLAARDEMDFGPKPKKDTSSEAPRRAGAASNGRAHHISAWGWARGPDLSWKWGDWAARWVEMGPESLRGPGKRGPGRRSVVGKPISIRAGRAGRASHKS